jgi:hypothetical protein
LTSKLFGLLEAEPKLIEMMEQHAKKAVTPPSSPEVLPKAEQATKLKAEKEAKKGLFGRFTNKVKGVARDASIKSRACA